VRDIAVLLADEIVTNALVHSNGDIQMSVEDSSGVIRVEVSDTSSASPLVRSPSPRDERGRGMLIVEALASAWGVVQRPEGKIVWFMLDMAEPKESGGNQAVL
jgi:anti-sigma regulatory factor (Ser/Thr protein kinase)